MKYLSAFFLLGIPLFLQAQIRGAVTDLEGEPLPFVSVYLEGTSTGTVTNTEGVYSLDAPQGVHVLVFRFIGYETRKEPVRVSAAPVEVNVQLSDQAIELTTVEVRAGEEDPAYPIIRKAMEKRKYYRDLVERYSCQTYMKSLYRMKDAPEKIMGQEVGDMGGILDSNRQGIIYFSESESEMYFQEPDQRKEIMQSSKVSGSDNSFSFNRASLMDMNFYENNLDLMRNLISPIGSGAFFYYRYRLEGTFYDDQGRLINKIEVLPKRAEDPVFAGYIYIVEDLWNIQSVDFSLTGKNIKQPILDTLYIKQVYVPVKEPDRWMPINQSLEFSFAIFGFDVGGYISTQFSEYSLDPDLPEGFFNNETFRVEEGANDRALTYWDSIRPVPLTGEESDDYVRKDSLKQIWESKEYLDSIDQRNNRFNFGNLFFGYSYNNSYKRRYFSVDAPLNTIGFNAVQGWYGSLRFNYRHYPDRDEELYYSLTPSLTYSFADEQLRGGLEYFRLFNRTHYTSLRISGGRQAMQFNEQEPVGLMINNIYSLFWKENYLKLYDKYFGKVRFGHELRNGLFLWTSLEYADRRGLVNNTNFSFSKKDENYFWNVPTVQERVEEFQETPSFDRSRALIWEATLRIRVKQKYWTYPDRKVILGSTWPDLYLKYRKGISAFDSDVQFDFLSASLSEDYSLGLLGEIAFFAEGGIFLNGNPRLEFMDRAHFLGNQLLVMDPDRILRGFFRLPFYDYSTNDRYVQLHAEHQFNGFILDKIPLLNKLGWSTVVGASTVIQPDRHYWELNVGIDNIGIDWLRLFRVDLVLPFPEGRYDGPQIVLAIGM